MAIVTNRHWTNVEIYIVLVKWVIEKIIVIGQMSHWTNVHIYILLDKRPIGQMTHWTNVPLDKCPIGQMGYWTNDPLDKCPLDKWPLDKRRSTGGQTDIAILFLPFDEGEGKIHW